MSDQSSGAMTLWSRARAPVAATAIAIVLMGAAVLLAPISQVALTVIAITLLALVVYVSLRWPRATIVIVVLSPILDRYVVSGALPAEFPAHLMSEGLLLSVSVTLGFQAWRTGKLRPALRHPVTAALIGFVALAAVSALLNGVPPLVALVGVAFTVDAAALYFLPRLVGFSVRQAILAVAAFVAVVTAASVIVLLQAILAPDIFGLRFVTGRFGEIYRLAAFIGDPNVFGTFAAAASPFALLAATTVPRRRWQASFAALAFLLALTLWLSFSRGSWLAMVLGVLGVLLILDRRTLVLAMGVLVLSFVTAEVMPRDLAIPVGGPGPSRPDLVDSTIGRVDTVGSGRDLRTLFVINALPILADHPALGVGPGRYGGAAADLFGTPIYTEYGTDELFTNRTQRTVDNFWLHLVVEAGLLGLGAFLAATLAAGLPILSAARNSVGWRRVLLGGAAAASAALAVSAVSTMLLEANSVAFLFWFLLGVGGLVAAPAVTPPHRAGTA